MASVLKRLVALAICISFPIFLLCKIVPIVLGKEELVIFDLRMQASVESEITTTAPLICTTSFSSYICSRVLAVGTNFPTTDMGICHDLESKEYISHV